MTAAAPDMVRLFAISMVEVVAAVSVKARFVEVAAPVYCSVPPPRTRFAATFVAAPRFPATPPLPIVVTLSVPALIVVTPVNVLTALRVTVPAVVFVTAPVPARMADTVPLCRFTAPVTVKTPLVPVTTPPYRTNSALTVHEYARRSMVPPVIGANWQLPRALFAPTVSVPELA